MDRLRPFVQVVVKIGSSNQYTFDGYNTLHLLLLTITSKWWQPIATIKITMSKYFKMLDNVEDRLMKFRRRNQLSRGFCLLQVTTCAPMLLFSTCLLTLDRYRCTVLYYTVLYCTYALYTCTQKTMNHLDMDGTDTSTILLNGCQLNCK